MAPQHKEVDYRKLCTLCSSPRNVLVRCQIDSTGQWHFVCPGTCWRRVSGGVIDGDGQDDHKWYKYGGMWKNKHAAVSAKKPKSGKAKQSDSYGDVAVNAVEGDEDSTGERGEESDDQRKALSTWNPGETKYTKNDKVNWDGRIWICRKSHLSDGKKTPEQDYSGWKEAV